MEVLVFFCGALSGALVVCLVVTVLIDFELWIFKPRWQPPTEVEPMWLKFMPDYLKTYVQANGPCVYLYTKKEDTIYTNVVHFINKPNKPFTFKSSRPIDLNNYDMNPLIFIEGSWFRRSDIERVDCQSVTVETYEPLR